LWPAGAILATVVFSSLLVMIAGASPLTVFWLVFKGAAGSQFALLETLTRATPLIFTGLAVAVAFRAKLWNIGAEAQLYLGAVMTVVIGTGAVTLPSAGLIPLIMIAAMLTGALALLGPAVLKTKFGVDEVVTTLLLNFIVLLFVSMLLEGPLKDPMGLGWPQSRRVIEEAQLPRLIKGKRLHFGFILAIASAIVVWVIMKKTTLGYEMRAVGTQCRSRALCRHPGQPGDRQDGSPVGRACGAGRVFGSRGSEGQPDARSVAGVRLHRHRRGDAGDAQPTRRDRRGDLRCRDLRRRRCDEPQRQCAELHCRGDGRDIAADHGRGDHADALPRALEVT
jgi:ABC-type uncharacterized transport system permease subunit